MTRLINVCCFVNDVCLYRFALAVLREKNAASGSDKDPFTNRRLYVRVCALHHDADRRCDRAARMHAGDSSSPLGARPPPHLRSQRDAKSLGYERTRRFQRDPEILH